MNSEQILRERKEMELTQVELADYLGVSGNTVARWERGEVNPEHPKMLRLAFDALRAKLLNGKAVRINAEIQAETMENLRKSKEIIERMRKM